METELLCLCKYYKGELKNPYNYTLENYDLLIELKCHFWDYEEMFVNDYENVSSLYPKDMSLVERFKYYINGCINKCTPSEYDPYTAYFDGVLRKKIENKTLQNVSKEQVEIDILEHAIKSHESELERLDLQGKNEAYQFRKIERKLVDLKAKLESLKTLNPTESERIDNPDKAFEYDPEMIARVYEFLIDTKVYDCDFDKFVLAIKTANFKITKQLPRAKTKVKELIYQLQYIGGLGDDWYTKAAKSIGVAKPHFHNLDISNDWKNELIMTIKPGKPKNINKN
jgi:hypothetical protein